MLESQISTENLLKLSVHLSPSYERTLFRNSHNRGTSSAVSPYIYGTSVWSDTYDTKGWTHTLKRSDARGKYYPLAVPQPNPPVHQPSPGFQAPCPPRRGWRAAPPRWPVPPPPTSPQTRWCCSCGTRTMRPSSGERNLGCEYPWDVVLGGGLTE